MDSNETVTLNTSLASMTHRATTNLKELYLNLPTLIKPYTDHLSNYVLPYLDRFELTTIYGINLGSWCRRADDKQSILDFASGLSPIRNIVIKKKGHHPGESELVSSAKTLGFFWKIAEAIQGSRDLKCNVKFGMSLHKSSERAPNLSVLVIDSRTINFMIFLVLTFMG